MSVRVMLAGDYVFTVFDNLPAFSDHHANPDPGFAAFRGARLSHCSGKWLADRILHQTVETCISFFPPLLPCYTERPFGDPAAVELHRVQSTPANSLA